jgi:hypothetical protein
MLMMMMNGTMGLFIVIVTVSLFIFDKLWSGIWNVLVPFDPFGDIQV